MILPKCRLAKPWRTGGCAWMCLDVLVLGCACLAEAYQRGGIVTTYSPGTPGILENLGGAFISQPPYSPGTP